MTLLYSYSPKKWWIDILKEKGANAVEILISLMGGGGMEEGDDIKHLNS